jgi:hypothetical protein
MTLLLLLFLFNNPADQKSNTINYLIGTVSEVDDMAFSLEDGTVWRFTTQISSEPEGAIVIVGGAVSNSGMVYFSGSVYPVTLMDGSPRYERGFLTSLLFADTEKRTLFLSDGTTRRVTQTDYEFAFRNDTLVELIITHDRRFAINLSNPELIPISPPLRNP